MNSVSGAKSGQETSTTSVRPSELVDRVTVLEKLAAQNGSQSDSSETQFERLEKRAKNTMIGLVALSLLFVVSFFSDIFGLVSQVREERVLLEQSSLEQRITSAKRAYFDGLFLSSKGRFEALANEALQKKNLQEKVTEFLSAMEAARLLSDAADLCAKHALDASEEQRSLLLQRLASVMDTANELYPYDTNHIPLFKLSRCFRINQQNLISISKLKLPVAFRERGPLGEQIDFALKHDGSIVFLNGWATNFIESVELNFLAEIGSLPKSVLIHKNMVNDFKAVLLSMENRGLIPGITRWHGTMNPRLPAHLSTNVEKVKLRGSNMGVYFSFSEDWRDEHTALNEKAAQVLRNIDLLFFQYCFSGGAKPSIGTGFRSYEWFGPKERPDWEPCIGI